MCQADLVLSRWSLKSVRSRWLRLSGGSFIYSSRTRDFRMSSWINFVNVWSCARTSIVVSGVQMILITHIRHTSFHHHVSLLRRSPIQRIYVYRPRSLSSINDLYVTPQWPPFMSQLVLIRWCCYTSHEHHRYWVYFGFCFQKDVLRVECTNIVCVKLYSSRLVRSWF